MNILKTSTIWHYSILQFGHYSLDEVVNTGSIFECLCDSIHAHQHPKGNVPISCPVSHFSHESILWWKRIIFCEFFNSIFSCFEKTNDLIWIYCSLNTSILIWESSNWIIHSFELNRLSGKAQIFTSLSKRKTSLTIPQVGITKYWKQNTRISKKLK